MTFISNGSFLPTPPRSIKSLPGSLERALFMRLSWRPTDGLSVKSSWLKISLPEKSDARVFYLHIKKIFPTSLLQGVGSPKKTWILLQGLRKNPNLNGIPLHVKEQGRKKTWELPVAGIKLRSLLEIRVLSQRQDCMSKQLSAVQASKRNSFCRFILRAWIRQFLGTRSLLKRLQVRKATARIWRSLQAKKQRLFMAQHVFQ